MKSCFFTGHRVLPGEILPDLNIELDVTIRTLISKGVSQFYCGGARGFDTLAAERVLSLKHTYPFIRLFLILPCKSQADYWTDSERQRYSFVLSHADDVRCLYDAYNKHCMYERNKELINAAEICVCYLKEKKSGTAFTVALAASRHRQIIPLCLSNAEKAVFEQNYLHAQLDLESYEFGI